MALSEKEEFELLSLERERSKGSKPAAPAAPKEPTLGQQAYAGAYGLTKGILGGLGELEEFGAYTVPELFGARKKSERDTFAGRETIFPTMKEVEKGAEYIGILKPAPGTKTAEFVGEIAPAAVSGGKLLYDVSKPIIKKGGELISKARSQPLTEAAGKLEQELGTTAERTGKEIESKTKQEAQRLASEQARRGVAQRSVAGQLDEAKRIAKEESVTALNKIAKPTNEFQVGEGLRQVGKANEKQLAKTADRAAEVLKTKYFNEGRAKQKAGEYWSQSKTGTEFLKYLQDVMSPLSRGKYNDYEIAAAKDLNKQLQSIKYKGQIIRPEIEKIEKIIRDVKKLPSQATMGGADAIKQQHMGKMAQKLEDSVYGYVDEAGKAVEGFAPTGRTFRDVYRKMMQPLNAYESQVGQVLSKELEGIKGIFTSDASEIPAKVFQSPEQVRILEKMDISKKTLEPFAAQHAANELSKLNTAEQVKAWINSTKGSYLKEFPQLEAKVNKYAEIFAKNEAEVARTTQTAKQIRDVSRTVARDVQSDIKSLREMSAQTQKDIADGLYKIQNSKDVSTMASQSRSYILGLKQKGLIQESEANKLLGQISQVETAVKDRQAAINALKGILPWAGAVIGGGAITGYSLNKLLGGL